MLLEEDFEEEEGEKGEEEGLPDFDAEPARAVEALVGVEVGGGLGVQSRGEIGEFGGVEGGEIGFGGVEVDGEATGGFGVGVGGVDLVEAGLGEGWEGEVGRFGFEFGGLAEGIDQGEGLGGLGLAEGDRGAAADEVGAAIGVLGGEPGGEALGEGDEPGLEGEV